MLRLPTVKRMRRVVMWTVNRKFTSGSLAVIFDHSGRLLLVRERFRDRASWGLPGGYLKHGETHESNVCREIREELKIEVSEVSFVAFSLQQGVDHFDALYTVTLPRGLEPRPGRELTQTRWFPIDQLPASMTSEAQHALRIFKATTPDWGSAAQPLGDHRSD